MREEGGERIENTPNHEKAIYTCFDVADQQRFSGSGR